MRYINSLLTLTLTIADIIIEIEYYAARNDNKPR